MSFDRTETAVVFIDPQVDVLSRNGMNSGAVGASVTKNKTVENMLRISPRPSLSREPARLCAPGPRSRGVGDDIGKAGPVGCLWSVLYIAHEIARAHDGEKQAWSEDTEAVFTVRAPSLILSAGLKANLANVGVFPPAHRLEGHPASALAIPGLPDGTRAGRNSGGAAP